MKFLDLFAGIGGFRLGMEQAGHECVGYVEWDKYARKSYEAIHNTEGEWSAHDITTVTDGDLEFLRGKGIDVICGGFPCQAFSVAGKRGGFDDTRGTMFFEIARFAKQIKPRLLLLENVKGLLSHDKGNTFGTILHTLDELGYDCEWQVLNSKDFGVPQNRERVFIVGHLRGTGRREVFPIRRDDSEINSTKIIKVGNIRRMGKSQSGDVVSTDGLAPTMCSTTAQKDPTKIIVAGELDIKGQDIIKRVYDTGGISPSLTTMQGGNREPKVVLPVLTPDRAEKRQNGRRFKEDGEPMFTLTAQDRHGVAIKEATKKGYDVATVGDSINFSLPNSKTRRGRVGKGVANTLDTQCNQGTLTNDYRIRKLTPRECWRLQGFPDWAFEKAMLVNSNSQLYKQAGNSVTVNVVFEIAKRLG
ncbi:DNA cytosine methyltransferase [Priestia flexa]|uniref:DNA cytosine methyltransferase n=1 Tax=Priestia flexa TaxID=86664 RepID=UPI002492EB01|nr:DNA cytosine methyltransferase [Priestia flexa]